MHGQRPCSHRQSLASHAHPTACSFTRRTCNGPKQARLEDVRKGAVARVRTTRPQIWVQQASSGTMHNSTGDADHPGCSFTVTDLDGAVHHQFWGHPDADQGLSSSKVWPDNASVPSSSATAYFYMQGQAGPARTSPRPSSVGIDQTALHRLTKPTLCTTLAWCDA